MNTYLVKMKSRKDPDRVAYKVGHTKWPNALKRFKDEHFVHFDIESLGNIIINDKDPVVARNYCKLVEECFKTMYPKNFRLEEHFNYPAGKFDGLSGITEMFILEDGQSEDKLVNDFQKVRAAAWKALKK